MFKEKTYRIRLCTPMLGTVAKDPEVYRTFIESKKPKGVEEDESATVDKTEEKGWTGFHKDDQGLFIYDYMIKGFLKHAGNVLKKQVKVKALRSKIDDQLFVFPRRIYLGTEVPYGVIERPLRAMTMQGPRVTLARSDYIQEGVEIEFTLKWLDGGEITEELIDTLFDYGKLAGLGQFRNGGYGRFEVVQQG